MALTILRLVATMQPTPRTFHALEEIDHCNRFPLTMEQVKGAVEAASKAAKLESLTLQERG